MRSHTGVFVAVGTVRAYFWSRKKLNPNSSAEADLFGVNDVLAQAIWTQYFLKDQIYDIHDNIINQDNQGSIKLDNNGKWLSSNNRY